MQITGPLESPGMKRNRPQPSVGHWPSSVSYKGLSLTTCKMAGLAGAQNASALQFRAQRHLAKVAGGGRHGGDQGAAGSLPSNRELQTQGKVTELGLPEG